MLLRSRHHRCIHRTLRCGIDVRDPRQLEITVAIRFHLGNELSVIVKNCLWIIAIGAVPPLHSARPGHRIENCLQLNSLRAISLLFQILTVGSKLGVIKRILRTMNRNYKSVAPDRRISVIVTAYNSRYFLKDALESAMNQSYQDLEIVVVDDGSVEESAKLISMLTSDYKKTKLIRQANQGLSAARNAGVRHSSGRYLAFLDHDDIWRPDFLKKMVVQFQNGMRLGAVFCRAEHMTPEGRLTARLTKPKLNGLTVKDFLISDPICCGSSFIIDRFAFESLEGFDPEFIRAETPELAIRMLMNGWRIKGVDEVLVNYRNTPGGLTSGRLLREYRLKVLKKALALNPELGSETKYRFLIWLNQLRIQVRRMLIS